MAIFNSYVKLPEGNLYQPFLKPKTYRVYTLYMWRRNVSQALVYILLFSFHGFIMF